MGVNDRERDKKDAARKAAETRKTDRIGSRRSSGTADWSGVDGPKLLQAVAAIAVTGGAIRLGYTRDGGAYALGIYGDGDPYTVYATPDEGVEGILDDIIEKYGKA